MPWECGPLLWWLGTWKKEVPWFWSQIFVNSESQISQKGEGIRYVSENKAKVVTKKQGLNSSGKYKDERVLEIGECEDC